MSNFIGYFVKTQVRIFAHADCVQHALSVVLQHQQQHTQTKDDKFYIIHNDRDDCCKLYTRYFKEDIDDKHHFLVIRPDNTSTISKTSLSKLAK